MAAKKTTALAKAEETGIAMLKDVDPAFLSAIKETLCPEATDGELKLMGQICAKTGLDPFTRQIYGIKRKSKKWNPDTRRKEDVYSMTFQVSIDGARLVAQRSGKYQGQEGPYWCGEDGAWVDVWLKKEAPKAAKVAVFRNGFTQAVWGVALWDEYCQMWEGNPTGMWKKMGSLMLAKCAEMLALRKGFPNELSDLYSAEELSQMDNLEEADRPKVKAAEMGQTPPKNTTEKAASQTQTPPKKERDITPPEDDVPFPTEPEPDWDRETGEIIEVKEDPDPGDTVCGFGKFKGRKVNDIPIDDLKGHLAYLKDQCSKANKNPSPIAKEWMESVGAYFLKRKLDLDSMAERSPSQEEELYDWEIYLGNRTE